MRPKWAGGGVMSCPNTLISKGKATQAVACNPHFLANNWDWKERALGWHGLTGKPEAFSSFSKRLYGFPKIHSVALEMPLAIPSIPL